MAHFPSYMGPCKACGMSPLGPPKRRCRCGPRAAPSQGSNKRQAQKNYLTGRLPSFMFS